MQDLNNFLSEVEKSLSGKIELSLNYQDIARRLYPFLVQEHKKDYNTFIEKHISNLKKSITTN